MVTRFQQIEKLPRRNASQVKNKWGELVREIRAHGSVAVTHHSKVEMVVIEAEQYREMSALIEGIEESRRTTLAKLTAEFDQHLAELKSPGARERLDAAMNARGRATPRPKAGTSF